MKKILYVKHADSSFILTDQRILEKHFHVVPFIGNQKKGGFNFIRSMLSLGIFILSNLRGTSLMVTWFGDYHSAIMVFLGKMFRIRVVIFAGGQEAISYPELGKGVYLNRMRGRFVRYALRNAALIIPNHDSLLYHENYYYTPEGKKDGIRHHVPGFRTPFAVVGNGIDTSRFFRDSGIEKDPVNVLTVGTMSGQADFVNKGFDLFIEMARRNPDLEFTLVGIKRPFLPWISEKYRLEEIPNLELVYSFCPDDVLFRAYNRATVFVQASITEGMPNTLNEAMLCECVPVGSRVNGIPDAIGDTGIIVNRRSVEELESAVRRALLLNTGTAARNRVLSLFSLDRREEALLEVFDRLTAREETA